MTVILRSAHRLWIIPLALAVLDLAWRLIAGFSLLVILPFESALFAAASLLLVLVNVRMPLATRRLRRLELALAGLLLLGAIRALLWFVGGDVASANLVVLSIFIASGMTLLVIRHMTIVRPPTTSSPDAEVIDESAPIPGIGERWGHEIAGVVLALFVVGATAIMCYQMWEYTPERTFISLRYADHLRAGDGLVWNRGEDPAVEGYESLLWVLLLGLVQSTTSDVVNGAKVVSAGAFAIMLILLFVWTYRATTGRSEPRIARLGSTATIALVLLTPGIPLTIVSASETSLVLLALTVLLIAAEAFCIAPTRTRAAAFGAALAIALLAHPVLLLFSIATLAVVVLIRQDKRILIRNALLPAGVVFLGWTVWRTLRTGYVIPHPLNRLDVTAMFSISGLTGFGDLLLSSWPLWIFALAGAATMLRRSRSSHVLSGALVLALALAAVKPDEFFILALPPLTILTGVGLVSFVTRHARGHSLIALVGFAIVAFAWHSGRYTPIRVRSADEIHAQRHVFEALGRSLAEIDSTGKRSIAVAPFGAVGYLSSWNVIDRAGRLDHAAPLDASTLLELEPAVVALQSRRTDRFDPSSTHDAELFGLMQRTPYRPAAVLEIDAVSSLWIFAADTPILQSLGPLLQRRSGAFVKVEPEKKPSRSRR